MSDPANDMTFGFTAAAAATGPADATDAARYAQMMADCRVALRVVAVGRSDAKNVEITDGLSRGERYVAVGGFALKAELGKEAFAGEGHHH